MTMAEREIEAKPTGRRAEDWQAVRRGWAEAHPIAYVLASVRPPRLRNAQAGSVRHVRAWSTLQPTKSTGTTSSASSSTDWSAAMSAGRDQTGASFNMGVIYRKEIAHKTGRCRSERSSWSHHDASRRGLVASASGRNDTKRATPVWRWANLAPVSRSAEHSIVDRPMTNSSVQPGRAI